MKKFYIIKLSLLVLLALVLLAQGLDEIARTRVKAALHKSGEICVSYKDTFFGPKIDKHWLPRHYSPTGRYCPEEDFPEGVQLPVGQLEY